MSGDINAELAADKVEVLVEISILPWVGHQDDPTHSPGSRKKCSSRCDHLDVTVLRQLWETSQRTWDPQLTHQRVEKTYKEDALGIAIAHALGVAILFFCVFSFLLWVLFLGTQEIQFLASRRTQLSSNIMLSVVSVLFSVVFSRWRTSEIFKGWDVSVSKIASALYMTTENYPIVSVSSFRRRNVANFTIAIFLSTACVQIIHRCCAASTYLEIGHRNRRVIVLISDEHIRALVWSD